MQGMRAIAINEVEGLKTALSLRDYTILILGIRTGYRISEALSLCLGDVFKNGEIVECIQLNRLRLKGKKQGRSVPLHTEARDTLQRYIASVNWDCKRMEVLHGNNPPLFLTKNLNRMDRSNYWMNLKKAYARIGISSERIGSHSLRKRFAEDMYKKLDKNVLELQAAMGHRSLSSTQRYIEVDLQRVWNKMKE